MQHKRCEKSSIGRYLLAAYTKYGIENFKFQLICICFDNDCNKFEEDYIKRFDTLVPNGYNLQAGGKNSRQHPETIQKRVDKLKGRKYGPPSDATKKKISDSHQGIKNPNFGKKITDDRRAKLSEAMKNIWKDRRNNETFEECVNKTKQHLPSKKGLISNRKLIGKYDDNNNLLEEYESTVEAGLKNNIQRQTISKVCNGENGRKSIYGFKWKHIIE